jgi:hypothetical protein
MLSEGLIEYGELEGHLNAVLPRASKADIVSSEYQAYFGEIRRRLER